MRFFVIAAALVAHVNPLWGATSILSDPGDYGTYTFTPTLVHSDTDGPVGGRVLGASESAYGVNHQGVAKLTTASGSLSCTAALLGTGQHLLTAAHCGASGLQAVFEIDGQSVTIPVIETQVHPNYAGTALFGYDVAVLTLDHAAPGAIPRYDVNRSLNDLGVTGVAVGYGSSGTGETGAVVARGQKRAGLIEFEMNALPSILIQNGHTQLTADFDSGDPSNDAMALYYGMAPDLGFGVDEIGFAGGDSGGPIFQQAAGGDWVIAGVASYATRFNPPSSTLTHADVDGMNNGSWGEFSTAARVADPEIVDFIDGALGTNFTPVPEPSTGLLLLMASLLGFRRQRS